MVVVGTVMGSALAFSHIVHLGYPTRGLSNRINLILLQSACFFGDAKLFPSTMRAHRVLSSLSFTSRNVRIILIDY